MVYEKELIKVLQKACAEAKAEGKMEVAESMLEAGICFEEIYLFTGICEEDNVQRIEMEKEQERELKVNFRLEMRLKEWRYEHYKALKIPSYMVMSNRTLQEIATKIPRSREELMAIKGFGNASWDKYGEEILAITTGF